MAVIPRERMLQYEDADGGHVGDGLAFYVVDKFMGIVGRYNNPAHEAVGWSSKEHNRVEIICGDTDLVPRTVTVNGALDSSTTTLVLDSTNNVQQYDQLLNPLTGELLWISAAVASATDLTVERNYAGSPTAAIADNQVLRVVGPAVPEGVDAPSSPSSTGTLYTNWMQIREYTWQLSHRAKVTKSYEFMSGNRFREESARQMKQAKQDMNMQLIFGHGQSGSGGTSGATDASTTGGIRDFISTYATDLLDEVITPRDMMDVLQLQHDDLGRENMPTTVMGSTKGKRIWNAMFGHLRRDHGPNDRTATTRWDTYDTDVGSFTYMIEPDCLDDEWIFWRPSDVEFLHYTGGKWATGVYATQGWYDKGFLRGDYGYRWNNERRRARFYNFNTDLDAYLNVDMPF